MASKYGNKKVKFNGETFDSKLELDYYRYLLNQKELGEIVDIQMKPVFVLQPGFTYHCKSIRKITYTADFMFEDKHGIMLANSQGWIESNYYGNETNDGNLGLMFVNAFGDEPWIVKAGDKIGQCMFIKYLTAENGNSNKIRTGGFGSTGK